MKFKPYKVISSNINNLPIKSGQFIVESDTKKIYIDKDSGNRTLLSHKNTSYINTLPYENEIKTIDYPETYTKEEVDNMIGDMSSIIT